MKCRYEHILYEAHDVFRFLLAVFAPVAVVGFVLVVITVIHVVIVFINALTN